MMKANQTEAEAGSDIRHGEHTKAVTTHCKATACTTQSQLGEIIRGGRVESPRLSAFVYRARNVANLSQCHSASVSPRISCY